MLVTLSGIVILTSFMQFIKTPFPIEVTPSGITIDSRLEQKRNALHFARICMIMRRVGITRRFRFLIRVAGRDDGRIVAVVTAVGGRTARSKDNDAGQHQKRCQQYCPNFSFHILHLQTFFHDAKKRAPIGDTPCIVSPIDATQTPLYWEIEIRNADSYPCIARLSLSGSYSIAKIQANDNPLPQKNKNCRRAAARSGGGAAVIFPGRPQRQDRAAQNKNKSRETCHILSHGAFFDDSRRPS